MIRPTRSWAALAALSAAILIVAPLIGWPRVVRLPAVLVPALALGLLAARPWAWTDRDREAIAQWMPSSRAVWYGALAATALLGWIVLTRFLSGSINAVDFTVYFDRPLYQTAHGRPLFVETADQPSFSYRSQLAVHAHYLLFAVAPLYRLAATPCWLLALSVVAVTAGGVHTLRIVQRLSGSGLVAVAAALAFVLNANTARTLMFGFHPEVLYAWLLPAALDAALSGKRLPFVAAVVACACVKEDAFMPLFAMSVALALTGTVPRRSRWLFFALPTTIGLANLLLYYYWILPAFGSSVPAYAPLWGNYGPTPAKAAWGMVTNPGRVARDVLASGFWRLLLPHGLLSLAGWRWIIGTLPIVVLYSASANDQVQAFGLYYSIVLVPFLAIGAAMGALALARALFTRESSAIIAAAVAVLMASLVFYADRAGYSLRRWRADVLSTRDVMASISADRVVLVQSAIYPHAGYEPRVILLTRQTLSDPRYRDAAIVLAPGLDAYPFAPGELEALARQPGAIRTPGGLVIAQAIARQR